MYSAYLFDVDGTIYVGDTLLPGAAETLTALRKAGRRTIFLSNNATKTRSQYRTKLTQLGIPTPIDDIINSSFVMVQWLLNEMPQARLFVVGEEPLKRDLRAAGFQLSETAGEIDIVVASFDRTFVYQKLQIAFDAIRAGARLVATNPDRYCPVPGVGQPDWGKMSERVPSRKVSTHLINLTFLVRDFVRHFDHCPYYLSTKTPDWAAKLVAERWFWYDLSVTSVAQTHGLSQVFRRIIRSIVHLSYLLVFLLFPLLWEQQSPQ
jgi:hypothetical protein